MEIQPLQPVNVFLFPTGKEEIASHLIDIASDRIRVMAQLFIEQKTAVDFKSRFFSGRAIVTAIEFKNHVFTYTLDILTIHFKPGMIINEVL